MIRPGAVRSSLPAVLLATVGALAVAAWVFPFTIDDTFISLRYAENLASGLGPVFNPGERVEGYSTPLWVGLLALLAPLPGDLLLPSKLLSLLFFLACGWVVILRLARDGQPLLPATLLFIGSAPFAVWGVSGMETSLYAFLLLLWALAISAPRPGPARIVALGLLLLVTRPEAPLPVGLGFLLLFLRGRLTFRVCAAFLVPALLLLVARWAYFGDLLPNTYHAKHFQTPARWGITLWNYVRTWYVGPGLVPLLGVLAFAFRFRGIPAAGLALLCLWPALFAMLVGGDWMPLGRFLLPTLPIALWLTARFLADLPALARSHGLPVPAAHALLVLSLAVHAALGFHAAHAAGALGAPARNVADLHRNVSNGNPHYLEVVGRLRALSPLPASLAVGELGYFCYYVRVPCTDLHGLIDPVIARSRDYPNTVIGKKLPVGEEDFHATALGRHLLSRDPDVWVLAVDETGGERETLLGGRVRRIDSVGNFRIYRRIEAPGP